MMYCLLNSLGFFFKVNLYDTLYMYIINVVKMCCPFLKLSRLCMYMTCVCCASCNSLFVRPVNIFCSTCIREDVGIINVHVMYFVILNNG